MSTLKAPEFFVQTENGDLHAYWDPAILRIALRENKPKLYNWKSTGPGGCDTHCIEHPCGPCITGKHKSNDWVRVFSRHHGSLTLKYTEVSCMECFDHDEKCQECCPHDEHDHGICMSCELDRNDELCNSGHEAAEGAR